MMIYLFYIQTYLYRVVKIGEKPSWFRGLKCGLKLKNVPIPVVSRGITYGYVLLKLRIRCDSKSENLSYYYCNKEQAQCTAPKTSVKNPLKLSYYIQVYPTQDVSV